MLWEITLFWKITKRCFQISKNYVYLKINKIQKTINIFILQTVLKKYSANQLCKTQPNKAPSHIFYSWPELIIWRHNLSWINSFTKNETNSKPKSTSCFLWKKIISLTRTIWKYRVFAAASAYASETTLKNLKIILF